MTKMHGHAHQPAAPAAPAKPPPPQWQPLNWSFPFAPTSGNAADPQTWLKALASADGGFYPLGANGMFHGGIHFDAGTGGVLKQGDGVKVIADGDVVAYRLDEHYPELTYPTTPQRYARYSTSFVLVRHKLVLPPAPDKSGTSGTSQTAAAMPASGASSTGGDSPRTYQAPADDVLEVYSLYMHQLDWAGYKAAQAAGSGQSTSPIHSLPFWQGDRHYRVGSKANDRQAQPPQLNTPFRFDLNPADFTSSTPGDNAQLGSTAAGPSPYSLDGLTSQGDQKLRYKLPSDGSANTESTSESTQGARILDRVKGTVIGLLPRGGQVNISGDATSGWAQIATIISGTPVAAVAGGPPDPRAATGWVNLDELDVIVDPKPLGKVVVLKTPYPVKAGDVVGYLGEYQNSTQSHLLPPQPTRALLHVEVFTGAQINDFISKSRNRVDALESANKLPGGKPLLVVQQGAQLVKPADPQDDPAVVGLTLVLAKGDPGKGNWAKVQPTQPPVQSTAHAHGHHASKPKGTPVGNPVWVERKFAGKPATSMVQIWTDFPLRLANANAPAVGYQQVFSRAQLDQISGTDKAADEQGTQWWSITAGDADGKTISGWVCEKGHPRTQWQSPWSWPGFDTVDTTGVPLFDLYRRSLYEIKQLLDGEEQEFSIVAAAVNAGPFIARLEQVAKRQNGRKGNVVPADLKKALTVPWLATAVSHLMVRYESEWGGDMSKWEKLSPIMGAFGIHIWKAEMERIKNLQWWKPVKDALGKSFPSSPDVWHIHPIGLVGNFFKSGCGLDELIRKIGDIISGGEGGYESYNTGTNGPHGGVGHSYMTRPKGTVTGKTINAILATERLSYADPARFYTTGKYQTIIPTLREGMIRLGLTGEEKYDEDMQERMFSDFLIFHAGQGVLAKFIKQGVGTVDDAQHAASKEWASIATPANRHIKDGRVSDGTLSYYEGVNNRAYMPSTNKLRAILVEISQSR